MSNDNHTHNWCLFIDDVANKLVHRLENELKKFSDVAGIRIHREKIEEVIAKDGILDKLKAELFGVVIHVGTEKDKAGVDYNQFDDNYLESILVSAKKQGLKDVIEAIENVLRERAGFDKADDDGTEDKTEEQPKEKTEEQSKEKKPATGDQGNTGLHTGENKS